MDPEPLIARLAADLTGEQTGEQTCWRPAPGRWEFDAAFEDLMREREKSLVGLDSLDVPRWQSSYEHPHLGTLHAAPYTPDYAGPW